MKLTFSSKAWEQYLYWQSTDKKIGKTNQFAHQRYSEDTV
jgi:Txe/YoeB family toxin of Txe-Axe toxin-antitoxin module